MLVHDYYLLRDEVQEFCIACDVLEIEYVIHAEKKLNYLKRVSVSFKTEESVPTDAYRLGAMVQHLKIISFSNNQGQR